jgi:uncharacterized membrane protein YqiK
MEILLLLLLPVLVLFAFGGLVRWFWRRSRHAEALSRLRGGSVVHSALL